VAAVVIQELARMADLAEGAAETAAALLEEPASRGRETVEAKAETLLGAEAEAGLEQVEQVELAAAVVALEQHLQFLEQVLFTQKVEPPLKL
jgi:hypothetical protein